MFPGRSYRTRLPQIQRKYNDQKIRERDKSTKEKMKAKADDKKEVKTAHFCI